MDILNVFRGLKKSNSETKLGDRLSFGRKSKTYSRGVGLKSVQNSPISPRPHISISSTNSKSSVGRIIENIPDKGLPSLHSPRQDTDQFGNYCVPLVIKGKWLKFYLHT